MRRLSAFVLHAIAAGIMACGWLSFLDQTIAKVVMTQKGGFFLYLTNQGLLFAWSYMIVSLFCDVLSSVPAVVLHLKRTLLVIAVALAFVISSIYWPLRLFLPNLITPHIVVFDIPLWIDLAFHASPLATLLIDFFVFELRFSEIYVNKTAPTALVVFSISYASFVEYCAPFNGFFPYPFLTRSPFEVRILIYAIATGMALTFFPVPTSFETRENELSKKLVMEREKTRDEKRNWDAILLVV